MMSKEYNVFYDELVFAQDLLANGLTVLSKANFAKKSDYFQAFFYLSSGFERIMKLIIILDFYIKNGTFPKEKYIRKYGHDLNKLLIYINGVCDLNLNEVHFEIIDFLTKFSKKERYYNLNYIMKCNDYDPIIGWNRIENIVFNKVPVKTREKVEKNIIQNFKYNNLILIVGYENNKREEIRENNEFFREVERSNLINEYVKLYLIEVINELYIVLDNLNKNRNGFRLLDMARLFAVFNYGNDSEKRKRKNFIRE